MFGLHHKIEGEYHISRVKSDGTVVQSIGPFKNLITDVGLDLLGQSNAGIYSCMVGTSNATPAFSDVSLGNRVATAGSPTVSRSIGRTPSYHVNSYIKWRFDQGDASGNLSEIGVGIASSPGRPGGTLTALFSRALIVDGSGNPTTITVLPDEFLDVTYTLRFYVSDLPSAPYKITDPVTGIEHTLVSRLCNDSSAVTWYMGPILPSDRQAAFAPLTQNVSGVPIAFSPTSSGSFTGGTQRSGSTDNVISPYVPGSYSNTITGTVPLTTGNEGFGIGAIISILPSSGIFSVTTGVTISPPILKTATTVLTLSWKISWSRL